jgi:hypothetical protein
MADQLMEFAEKHIYYMSARIEHLETTLKYAVLSDVAREEVESELRAARGCLERTLAFKAERAARLRLN